MSALLKVTEQNFKREVLDSDLPVLVEFGAEWCGPCKQVAPELVALAREIEGKAKIVTVDIDHSPAIARQLGIKAVPTFVVFHRGRPVTGKSGAMRRAQLRELLEPVLPRPEGAVPPSQLAPLIRARKVVPVDTREPAAFARTHLPGAVNLPLDEIEGRLAELHMLPAPAVLYCRGGDQTKELSERLAEQGVSVPFIEGGLLAWEAEGLDTERPN
jgi:thioredoxin 1/putative thioredoxin